MTLRITSARDDSSRQATWSAGIARCELLLSLMAPLLILSGVQLWHRRLAGCLAGAAAGIQASIYLTVLSVNSTFAIRSGRVEMPGELPVWGMLAAATITASWR